LDALPLVNQAAGRLDLDPVTVWFSRNDDDAIARFMSGTSSTPAFVLFTDAHKSREALSQIPLTLLHELGHAYVESVVGECGNDDEEDAVEEFARDYVQGFKDEAIAALQSYAEALAV